MNTTLRLALCFLKVGIIGFGGGSALIPIIENEAISKRRLVSPQVFDSFVIVANITPGALPVKLAAAIGREAGGLAGMLTAALFVTLPGVAVTLAAVALLSVLGAEFINGLACVAVGVSAFIMFLLVNYIHKVLRGCYDSGIGPGGVAVMILTFFLTCGSELGELLGCTGAPLVDISAANVLVLAFFIIFYTRGKMDLLSGMLAGILSISFLLLAGKTPVINNSLLRVTVYSLMALLASRGFVQSLRERSARGRLQIKITLQELTVWFLLMLLAALPALLLHKLDVPFIGQGLLSILISFGGGESYLTVADGIFVDGGLVEARWFYMQLLPIANATPGPILCKLLSGISLMVGGWAAAPCGFALGIGASCGLFFLVYHVYCIFDNLDIFNALRQWILPIVCGLLLSTMIGMLLESIHTVGLLWGVGATSSIFLLNLALSYKLKLSELWLLLISAALACLLLLI